MNETARVRTEVEQAVAERGLTAVALEAGVGATALRLFLGGAAPLARTADRLAIWAAESSGPRWDTLERVLGANLLQELEGCPIDSLRSDGAGLCEPSRDVAARWNFLAAVVGDLSGSYDEVGIRRWFERARAQLDGKAPADLLQGAWAPEDEGPRRVQRLASALRGAREAEA